MTSNSTLELLTSAEPLMWLAVLISVFLRGGNRARIIRSQTAVSRSFTNEASPDYRALGAYSALRSLTALLYQVFEKHVFKLRMSGRAMHLVYASSYWTLYMLATISVFFIMAAILRSSLRPLPGLASAAMTVFRWAAILTLLIALAAHIPIFGVPDAMHWLDEVSVSFTLCVCSFELSLLTLLLKQLRRLGMFLRSRPVGIALGLAMLGCMDLLSAITINFGRHAATVISVFTESVTSLALLMWILYIVLPEPRRLPHSLSPASPLMRWNEIALRLNMKKRAAETGPFISRVEATVDEVLARHKMPGGLDKD